MQIQSFKVFSDLAETASFSRAAEINSITQSAVSQQIRALEQRYDVKLVERGRKNFSLTPEGRVFLEASQEILSTLNGLDARIHKLRNLVAGELRLATVFSIGLHELPPWLKLYRKRFPEVEVRVEYRRSSEVYGRVLEGQADLGLVACPSPRRGMKVIPFWTDRLVLICPPGHHLAGRDRVTLPTLKEENFVAFAPDLPTRREIDRRLRHAGVKVNRIREFENIETLKRAVEAENAVSIVPETSVRHEVESGTLVAISFTESDMFRILGALVRRSARISPALRELLLLLENAGRIGAISIAERGLRTSD